MTMILYGLPSSKKVTLLITNFNRHHRATSKHACRRQYEANLIKFIDVSCTNLIYNKVESNYQLSVWFCILLSSAYRTKIAFFWIWRHTTKKKYTATSPWLSLSLVISMALSLKSSENIMNYTDMKENPKCTTFCSIIWVYSRWIVKPGEFTNRGQGIKVLHTLKEIEKFVQINQRDSYIIQKYIDNPLLIWNGKNKCMRKFDIR